MDKKLFILIAITNIAFFTKAQDVKKLEKELEHKEVVINEKDSLIRCHILVHTKEISTSKTETYYWYDKNKIQANTGSYTGNLLDGKYEVTNTDGGLITQGEFKNGQKDGKWLSWSPNGKIKNTSRWNKGKISGKMREYNAEGKLIQITPFKNNMVHGTIIKYTDKTTIKQNYKKGILIWDKTIYKVPKRRGMFSIM